VRSGVDLHPRLLSKLLDDLDPQMHGLVLAFARIH
jgi:hypothetical protein